MKLSALLALLSNAANLFKRLLDKHDEHDRKRKQLRREERRASVAAEPEKAFADLFGQSDDGGLRQSHTEQSNIDVRPDTATTPVDNNS